MYIHAIIKDREGKLHKISVKNSVNADPPNGVIEQWKYALASNDLFLKFAKELHKYANEKHALVEVHTDNAILGKKLADKGYNVIYRPQELEEAI